MKMSDKKYASKEVLDVNVLRPNREGKYETAFVIKTTSENKIKYSKKDGRHLIVRDALIDVQVMEDVINGLYDGNLALIGKTLLRDTNDYKDYDTVFFFNHAQLHSFSFHGYVGSVASVEFDFEVNPDDNSKFIKIEVKDKD